MGRKSAVVEVDVSGLREEEMPSIYCPYCGKLVLGPGEADTCPHAVFFYNDEVGLYAARESFLEALYEVCKREEELKEEVEEPRDAVAVADYDLVLKAFEEYARSKRGAVVFAISEWGVACGPGGFLIAVGFVAQELKDKEIVS